jgi:aconitate hydratase
MSHNLFNTLQSFDLGNGQQGQFYSLPQLEKEGIGPISKLPISIRVVLESVLRNYDEQKISEADVRKLANWGANAERAEEIPFVVARIVAARLHRCAAVGRLAGDALGSGAPQ